MNLKIKIGKRDIGDGCPAYIIAEIGSNHNQDINQAKKLIKYASESGADAVKFQSIKFDQLYREEYETSDFRNWFKQIELDEAWYQELVACANSYKVDFLSSPTYLNSIPLLESCNVPAYKIASPQVQANPDIVKAVANTGKPLIMSMGYSEYIDIARAVEICESAGNNNLILLHCISKYPTHSKEANLRFINTLRSMTGHLTGFSDHTLDSNITIAAISLGACVIEKHITTDRNLSGPDHNFAITIDEFRHMVNAVRETEEALGTGVRNKLLPEEYELREKVALKLFASKDIDAGQNISSDMICKYRLNKDALKVSDIPVVLKCRAKKPISKGQYLTWDMFDLNG